MMQIKLADACTCTKKYPTGRMYYGFEACICDKLIAYGRKMDFLRKEAERQESADFMSNRKPVNLWQGRHKKVNDEERF